MPYRNLKDAFMQGYPLFSLSSVHNHLRSATTLQDWKTSGAQMCPSLPGPSKCMHNFQNLLVLKAF